MSKLSSVFLGTPEFALSSLEAAHTQTEVLAVISQPDRARGRGQKLSPSAVKARAQELGILVFNPPSLKKPSAELDELWAFLNQRRPDLLLVTAYGNLLPQNFLDLPTLGPINVHASLLPRWRGAAPIQRSLEAGDSETGVSLQKMLMELDAGDVLAEEKISIPLDLDAHQLTAQLAALGGSLLETYLKTLNQSPVLKGQAQNPAQITLARKITKEEANYSPAWSAIEFHNRVRAFAAWPKVEAQLLIEGSAPQKIKILATRTGNQAVQGQSTSNLLLADAKVWVVGSSGQSGIELVKIQPENRGPVEAWAYLKNIVKDSKVSLSLAPV